MALSRCGRDTLRRVISGASAESRCDRITNPVLFSAHGLRYRKLEVILTTTIDKLGRAGETVKVAPGHFRNHLMPKLLAVPNIDKYAFLIREQRKLYQKEEEEPVTETKADDAKKEQEAKMKEYQTAAKILDNARLVLRRYIKINNDIRDPVTKEEIVAEVARQLKVDIKPENLQLSTPLKSLGEYEVPLRLPRDIPRPEGKIQWTLTVKIRRK
ncbi:50S ribosomal protein L9 [Rhynchospora pubera]|uniref:Large ribosomal subunit protein bL9c n=1 Tax=Rhynchospora pubera TaxID=906938 RepID=A0AAV8EEZ6_9POAL|nr:50S ribosomal protein L9 [Rhynchospora pubera]